MPNDDFILKNYKICDHRRNDGYAGAAILFKNNITFKRIDLPEFDIVNATAATTCNLPQNITFLTVYVTEKNKGVDEATVRLDLIQLLETTRNMNHCIIGGDFNAFNNAWGSNYNDVRGL